MLNNLEDKMDKLYEEMKILNTETLERTKWKFKNKITEILCTYFLVSILIAQVSFLNNLQAFGFVFKLKLVDN